MASDEYEIDRGRGGVLAALARNNRVVNGPMTRPRARGQANLRRLPTSRPCPGRRNNMRLRRS